MKAQAKAHSNIALIKYWGKRDSKLNLPAVGSISLTLDALHTTTSVHLRDDLNEDSVTINDKPVSEAERKRVTAFLDIFRNLSSIHIPARVISENNFPTAAGLASSASGFAALALAANKAFSANLNPVELSEIARRGSGSAARSIFGGIVEMHKGNRADGKDAVAEQLAPADYWDLRLLIALTSKARKKTTSTDGMNLSRETSPYYEAWVSSSEKDLQEMRSAIRQRDFQKLGEMSEYSCLKMHALPMSSRPGLFYWNNKTFEILEEIRAFRAAGLAVYFTIDAGPQVKALCEGKNTAEVKQRLAQIDGVLEVLESRLGGPAMLTGDDHD